MRLNHPEQFASTNGDVQDIAHFLSAVTGTPVARKPYSHLIAHGVLRDDLLDALVADYPTEESMKTVADRIPGRRYSDRRMSLSLPEPADPDLATLPQVYQRLSGLLRNSTVVGRILRMFPAEVNETLTRTGALTRRNGFNLRVAIELNYDRSGFELRPHTDGRLKLVTGLLYLAEPGDPEDLGTRIYRAKDPKFTNGGSRSFPVEQFEEVALVPYVRNNLLLFGRCDWSFHGVAATDSDVPRRLIQFSIVLDIEQEVINAIQKLNSVPA